MPASRHHDASVVIVVADGARPDTLAAAIDDGALPALARLRAEGGVHTVVSCFPSVTGPAYAPLLTGRLPGAAGLPGIRWLDRARGAVALRGRARSYVGPGGLRIDRDLDPGAPTLFELAPSIGALSVITRGLPRGRRVGSGARFTLRAARAHFAGGVDAWLAIDRDLARDVRARVRALRPRVVFAAFAGVDKASHAEGHEAPRVRDALAIVDDAVGGLRRDAEADGRWRGMHLWVVSDHGHAPVSAHDDLAALLEGWGLRVLAHPWLARRRADVAVMVGGNAMAHLYLEPAAREREPWPTRAPRWSRLVERLLERPSVDLVLLPHAPGRCEVRAGGRGAALVEVRAGGRLAYRPLDGDPLALGEGGEHRADAWLERSRDGAYPDAVLQIAGLADAARAGDVILSASPGWDFRSRWEPVPHVSSHGSLHRDHMLVPLLLDRPARLAPRRTADIMSSALAALGIAAPGGVAGRSFV